MKLLRIFQPRNPLFWLMLLIGGFALANAALGTWLLWRLMKDAEPKPQAEP